MSYRGLSALELRAGRSLETRSRANRLKRRLDVESLEGRQMLSGMAHVAAAANPPKVHVLKHHAPKVHVHRHNAPKVHALRGAFAAPQLQEQPAVTYYTGYKEHAIDYNPTWPTWSARQYVEVGQGTVPIKGLTSNTLVGNFPNDPNQNKWLPGEFANPAWGTAGNPDEKFNSMILYKNGKLVQKNWIISNTDDTLTLLNKWGPKVDLSNPRGYTFSIYTKQLEDSDFYNTAFKDVWNTPRVEDGKSTLSDLQTIRNDGFNLIRLYNWNPARSLPGSQPQFDGHRSFLKAVADFPHTITINGNTVDDGGLKVVVPVSNYFLADYDWGTGGVPTAKTGEVYYPFASAPQLIQNDFNRFIASIKDGTGKISEAVHSIEIGNEIDLSNSGSPVSADIMAGRILWWTVNLERELAKPGLYREGQAHPMFTIPVSNADQDANVIKGSTPVAGTDNTITIQIPPNDAVWRPSADWAQTHLVANHVQMRILQNGGSVIGDLRTITGATPMVFTGGYWQTTLTIEGTWGANTGNPVVGTIYQTFDPKPISWFQVFAGGTTQQENSNTVFRFIPPNTSNGHLPDGPVSQFTVAWPGLREALGGTHYAESFYNSYQTYKTGLGLQEIASQYSHYTPNPDVTQWSSAWPGEQFEVPILFSEVGRLLGRIDPAKTNDKTTTLDSSIQQQVIVNDVAAPLEQVWAESTQANPTNLMGYGIFEYNDEPNKNDSVVRANNPEAWDGLYTYYQSSDDVTTFPSTGNAFREEHVETPNGFHLVSGTTLTPFETIYGLHYDLYKLFPVTAGGVSTVDKLKKVFTFGKVNANT